MLTKALLLEELVLLHETRRLLRLLDLLHNGLHIGSAHTVAHVAVLGDGPRRRFLSVSVQRACEQRIPNYIVRLSLTIGDRPRVVLLVHAGAPDHK